MTRQLHLKQSRVSGYFGGYIGKPQKVGKLETKKCIDKMYASKSRNQGKTERAIISDLQVGRGVAPRIKSREGLLIFQLFDLTPYTEGIAEGTDLLLKTLNNKERKN